MILTYSVHMFYSEIPYVKEFHTPIIEREDQSDNVYKTGTGKNLNVVNVSVFANPILLPFNFVIHHNFSLFISYFSLFYHCS